MSGKGAKPRARRKPGAVPGLFIPYRLAASVRPVADYAGVRAAYDGRRAAFERVIAAIDAQRDALAAIPWDAPALSARWNQDWFPGLDAAVAYALVRATAPRLVVEIGSGHSTRFLARAAADGGTGTRIVAIDPAPRASIAVAGVEHLKATLQDAGEAPFRALAAGDILFVDSSHVLMPGTDVDLVLNRIMPALQAGALVHLHDIFLPEPYPVAWAWRGYNEQNAVAALLQGGAWQPMFSSRYARAALGGRLARSAACGLRLPAGAYESSLWLCRA